MSLNGNEVDVLTAPGLVDVGRVPRYGVGNLYEQEVSMNRRSICRMLINYPSCILKWSLHPKRNKLFRLFYLSS